jgi:hypothetical protein
MTDADLDAAMRALRKQKGLAPLTQAEAEKAYDEAPSVPLEPGRIEEIVRSVTAPPPAAVRPGPATPPVFALWNPWACGWLTDAQHVVYAFGSAAAAEEWQDGEENEVVELVPVAVAARPDAATAAGEGRRLSAIETLAKLARIAGPPPELTPEQLARIAARAASPDWKCTNCGRLGVVEEEVGMGRCPACGHELDEEDEAAVSPPAAGRPGPETAPMPDELWAVPSEGNPGKWEGGSEFIAVYASRVEVECYAPSEAPPVLIGISPARAARLASEAADAARAEIVGAIEEARDSIRKPCDRRDGLNHALSLARSAGAGEGREGGRP